MANPIVLTCKGLTARFAHKKLDRSKLYGSRRRIPLDADGKPCERAEITDDGQLLIRAGMTAQGYFDEGGRWIPNAELQAMSESGQLLEKRPSTLGLPCEMVAAKPEELLDLNVASVYMLTPEDVPDGFGALLTKGAIYRFPFNYRSDFHEETAYLVCNDEGCFAVVGTPVEVPWIDRKSVV
jgi:hypothetical protein